MMDDSIGTDVVMVKRSMRLVSEGSGRRRRVRGQRLLSSVRAGRADGIAGLCGRRSLLGLPTRLLPARTRIRHRRAPLRTVRLAVGAGLVRCARPPAWLASVADA